ncbi:carboxymuconolactone decarboxylase family protein [Alteromonas macleodii]|uniref:carboxymuconolactone decarboxylase family protein n=1 Tax=Alteromonas macleodii TaxID=28108 RepID=UPI0020767E36|nr:carboxymuconolactone decarboxylase family protein [Alteromonas macleodii]USI28968.1 carboxymuconolactone decarboxylase family protein [Alteromonas macleodii]
MPRINIPDDIVQPSIAAHTVLRNIEGQLGFIPNMFRILSKNTTVFEGLLGLIDSLSNGTISSSTRERIALAVAEINESNYCLAAHSFIGRNQNRLSQSEMIVNRRGSSLDAKAASAVEFAVTIAKQRGKTSKADFDAIRSAGYNDAEIIEIIALVSVNIFTNYLNETLDTDIDFPKAGKVVSA